MSEQIAPPVGAKPASICAWSRIGDLAEAILRNYQSIKGSAFNCRIWAKEIIAQCDIIQQFPLKPTEDPEAW